MVVGATVVVVVGGMVEVVVVVAEGAVVVVEGAVVVVVPPPPTVVVVVEGVVVVVVVVVVVAVVVVVVVVVGGGCPIETSKYHDLRPKLALTQLLDTNVVTALPPRTPVNWTVLALPEAVHDSEGGSHSVCRSVTAADVSVSQPSFAAT